MHLLAFPNGHYSWNTSFVWSFLFVLFCIFLCPHTSPHPLTIHIAPSCLIPKTLPASITSPIPIHFSSGPAVGHVFAFLALNTYLDGLVYFITTCTLYRLQLVTHAFVDRSLRALVNFEGHHMLLTHCDVRTSKSCD